MSFKSISSVLQVSNSSESYYILPTPEKKVVDKLKKKKKSSNPALSMALRQEKVIKFELQLCQARLK